MDTSFSLFVVIVLAIPVILSRELFSNKIDDKSDTVSVKSSNISKHPVLIVISFDGFRFDYFDRIDTPNLDLLKSKGSSVLYMRNQFITKTFPNHMSIATGLHLESHGVVDNIFYDPVYDKIMEQNHDEFWNFDNVTLPLWTLNELAGEGRASGTMMWPGSNVPYGPNMTLPSKFLPWKDNYPFESRIDQVVQWITDPQEPVNLVFMYFEEPDEIAHGFGPESDNVTQFIKKLDDTTGYLIKKLKSVGVFEKVNLMLLSDHGFQEIKPQDMINISSVLSPDSHKVYGSTPILHIQPNPGKTEEVLTTLQNFSNGRNFSVYTKESMLPIWHYSNNRRIMPIVLVADLGYVFEDFSTIIEGYNKKYNLTPSPDRVYGTHGYDNRNLPMHPFFLSHGPLFKSGFIGDPFENIDLFPLICQIIGIHTPPNNGSLAIIQTILAKKGFGSFGGPVGWAIGTGMLFGVMILLGIISLVVSSTRGRRDQKISLNSQGGYRYVNRTDQIFEKELGSPGSGATFVQVHSPGSGKNQEEYQALLLSSSNEEMEIS